MVKKRKKGHRTNEQRLICTSKQVVYRFCCQDCDDRFVKTHPIDKGESYSRSMIDHRCHAGT